MFSCLGWRLGWLRWYHPAAGGIHSWLHNRYTIRLISVKEWIKMVTNEIKKWRNSKIQLSIPDFQWESGNREFSVKTARYDWNSLNWSFLYLLYKLVEMTKECFNMYTSSGAYSGGGIGSSPPPLWATKAPFRPAPLRPGDALMHGNAPSCINKMPWRPPDTSPFSRASPWALEIRPQSFSPPL